MTIRAEIAEGAKRIEDLEQRVAAVKADTAAALHNVNVQTRYASRVQNAARGPLSTDAFARAMAHLIEADRAALDAKGE